VRVSNLASAEFSIAELTRQARQAVARDPSAWVTVDVGVHDLCARAPLATFSAQLDRGLTILWQLRPTTTTSDSNPIPLSSIEDLTRTWRVLHAGPSAGNALKSRQTLPCRLGYDVTRAQLAQLRGRVASLDAILSDMCFKHHYCVYDIGARSHMQLQGGLLLCERPRERLAQGQTRYRED